MGEDLGPCHAHLPDSKDLGPCHAHLQQQGPRSLSRSAPTARTPVLVTFSSTSKDLGPCHVQLQQQGPRSLSRSSAQQQGPCSFEIHSKDPAPSTSTARTLFLVAVVDVDFEGILRNPHRQ